MIDRANQRVDAAVFHPEAAQVFERFFLAKINQFAFDLGANYERFRSEVMLGVILNEMDILRGGICLIIFATGARSASATLQAKRVGFEVSRKKLRATIFSSGSSGAVIAGFPESRCGKSFSTTAFSIFAFFSPARTSFCNRSCRFWSDARSASTSSVLITSMSRTGSIVALT